MGTFRPSTCIVIVASRMSAGLELDGGKIRANGYNIATYKTLFSVFFLYLELDKKDNGFSFSSYANLSFFLFT